MKCGHVADSKDPVTDKPLCSLCAGTNETCCVLDDPINLSVRRARCYYYGQRNTSNRCGYAYCECETKSSKDLPYFAVRLMEDFDVYYCGCRGFEQGETGRFEL